MFDKLFCVLLVISPRLVSDDRIDKLLNGKINKEIIIIGSSRGARNLIASEISNTVNLSAYNLSFPGSDIEFHEFLLRTLIKYNSKPKIVILPIDHPIQFFESNQIKFRLDALYPYSRYDYINDELVLRGEKSQLSKYFCLARVNKSNFDLRKKTVRHLDSMLECGSMPISFQRTDRKFEYSNELVDYDVKKEVPKKILAFQRFQQICLDNDIKLLIVFPPNFNAYDEGFENRVRGLIKKDVFVYTYNKQNEVYLNKSYYYDESHLAKNGAHIFTKEVTEIVKGLLINLDKSK